MKDLFTSLTSLIILFFFVAGLEYLIIAVIVGNWAIVDWSLIARLIWVFLTILVYISILYLGFKRHMSDFKLRTSMFNRLEVIMSHLNELEIHNLISIKYLIIKEVRQLIDKLNEES